MPRRRPPRPPHRPSVPASGREAVETKADGEWVVRRLTGAGAPKTYTCPGCHHPVRPGTAHVVAWPVEKSLLSDAAIEERRHWHTLCWSRRR